MKPTIKVIGAGLAGCEAAWRAANSGCRVELLEMKPLKRTPAHRSDLFGELVCSNSLRSNVISNAAGLLKEELKRCHSLVMEAAMASEVPAGSALAVDRELFASYITDKIRSHPDISVWEGEAERFDGADVTVVATGPLTSEALSAFIAERLGGEGLHFYDAAAPIVDAASVDMEKAFLQSRYDKGEASYLNCPMNEEEYRAFWEALTTARQAVLHDFENPKVFEGCMPVEVMARRGYETLLYGPLKPVGLRDPRTGREPFAVVQLRMENSRASMYNLVGFQTNLVFEEQKRVFGMIPGLEKAVFLRYGVMHRNTFIDSPRHLCADYSLRADRNIFFAGQMTGVEGYIESAASGLAAGYAAAARACGREALDFPDITVIGSMAHYISDPNVTDFQPMNANFGLVRPLEKRVKGGKRAKNEALAARSLEWFDAHDAALNGSCESITTEGDAENENHN